MSKLLQFPAPMMHMLWWVFLAAAVDAAVGIIFALFGGTLDMEKVGHWLVTNVLSIIVPVVVVAVLVGAGMFNSAIFYAAAATAIATLVGGIASKIGIPLKFSQNAEQSSADTQAK